MKLLEIKNLRKIYTTRFGGNHVQALSNVSFSVEKGEYVAIMGESGSGQTILMVTHSIKAACHAKRVLFIKDGEVFHQIYKANMSEDQMYQKISDTLTIIATGGAVK